MEAPRGGRAAGRGIDWSYVTDAGLTLGVLALLAVFTVVQDAGRLQIVPTANAVWGNDFKGGLWPAANAVLHGSSPYVQPTLAAVRSSPHGYFWPPVLAVLSGPLAELPYAAAVAIWNVVCLGSFALAIWLFGVRDWRMFAVGILSFPFQESLYSGQPEGLQLLALAITWRYRKSWLTGLPLGVVIASKLIAWPYLIWLAAMRRFKAAACALTSIALLLVGSWSLIAFQSLLTYPQLLGLDARVWERSPLSMSAVTLLMHLGLAASSATVVSFAVGAGVSALCVAVSGGSDEGWFSAATVASLFFSPLMWTHYVVILFAPLAIGRGRDIRPWLVTALFWIWLPVANSEVRAAVTLGAVVGLAVWCAVPGPSSRASSARAALADPATARND